MFPRNFSIWRSLIGTAPTPAAVEDDRRLWVRYATDLHRTVQLGKKHGDVRILAHVRDLSAVGANLLVDKKIEPGQMLSLELLEGGDDSRTVLACVVRATQEAESRWALGCVFSRELDSEDLRQFGAPTIPAGENDKRFWTRVPGKVKVLFRQFGDLDGDGESAKVLNISATGIGLQVQSPLEAGGVLNLDLSDKSDRKVCSIMACVVHATRHGDAEFAVGCNFIRELTDQELDSLLG